MNSTTIIIILVLMALIILYNVKKPKNYETLTITEEKSKELVGESNKEALHEEEEIIGAIMGALHMYRELEGKDFFVTGIKRISKKESSWRKAGLK